MTRPDTFDVGPEFEGPVRFEFDERISENVSSGFLEDAVSVSPRTGEVSVSHGRSSLTVEVEGGFRPGLVYRVTLLPVVSDLFGNRLRDPFELVFSTGGEGGETTLAGDVWDRVTGRGVAGASLQAIGQDSLVHIAVADEDGIFAFRYLPGGEFRLVGFVDRDRDGEVGDIETQGTREIQAVSGDTLLIDLPLLDPDTTPAILLRAEMLDSVTLALEFDDLLEPSSRLGDVGILIESDSTTPPSVVRLWHEHEYADFVEAVADSFARLDSIDAAERGPEPSGQADTLVVDSVGMPDSLAAREVADTVPEIPRRQPPPSLPRARGSESAPPGRLVLPGNRVVALLDSDPAAGLELRLTVSGVENLNGLPGGGGEATLLIPYPAADSVPPEVVPDTVPAEAVPDTATTPGAVLETKRRIEWWFGHWRKRR